MTGKDDSSNEGGDDKTDAQPEEGNSIPVITAFPPFETPSAQPGADTYNPVPMASFKKLKTPSERKGYNSGRVLRALGYLGAVVIGASGTGAGLYITSNHGYVPLFDNISSRLSSLRSTDTSSETQFELDDVITTDSKNYPEFPSADNLVSSYYESAYANKKIELGKSDEHTLGALTDEFLQGFDAYFVENYSQMPTSELREQVKTSTMYAFTPVVQDAGYKLKDNFILSPNGKKLEKIVISLE